LSGFWKFGVLISKGLFQLVGLFSVELKYHLPILISEEPIIFNMRDYWPDKDDVSVLRPGEFLLKVREMLSKLD